MTTQPTQQDDATMELIGRAKAGDADAWNRLYGMYEADLQRRIRARMGRELRDRVGEADVMQTVWGEAIGSLKRFEYRGEGSFLAWISAILRHKIARKVTEEGRRAGQISGTEGLGLLHGSPAAQASVASRVQRGETMETLKAALKQLSEKEREVLQLSFFQGLKHREVGEILGISEDAARMRVTRAEAELTRVMTRLQGESP